MVFGKLASRLSLGVPSYLIARGEVARAAHRYREAALLYEEALRLRPERARLQIQCGHMRKEAGEFDRAEAHYLAALRRLPDDAELALQLGHFYKVAGRRGDARTQYERAARLRPDWDEPAVELANLRKDGWLPDPIRDTNASPVAAPARGPGHVGSSAFDDAAAELLHAETIGRLVPGLAPRRPDDLVRAYDERIAIKRLGRREPGFWGLSRTLRGVEALHGFCISPEPITEARVIVNGLAIHRGPVTGGHALPFAREDDPHRKYVFNIWLDFSQFALGRYAIELQLMRLDGETRSFHDRVVIAAPLVEADFPDSDALIAVSRDEDRSVEAQIRARPSIVRSARRALFPDGVRNVLAMRTDQLGDMIASIPAMTRLREIVPDARIVGLLTAANADFARTLDLFDEVIVVDFPDDPVERRRLMPLDEQEALRRRLEPYRFDIALDLAPSNVSRDLLPLAGARFTYGFGGGDWPWLTTEFVFNSHDRGSGMDIVPHSAKILAMIEALGGALRPSAPIIRRPALARTRLEAYGIRPDERYALLHMGARIGFSRWPHYPVLASLLLQHSDLRIVLMTEDSRARDSLPAELLASDRIVYLDRRLPFDDFDAFVAFATVLIGNDSGPKHLAALRGTNVVTLFTARVNWAEWGQENVGAIISRKVPCQGCAILHDPEDCGKGFTCIVDIKPREVFETAMRYILEPYILEPCPAEDL